MINERDINLLDITLPKDRRHPIMVTYTIKGKRQPAVPVASSSTGGRVISLLTKLIADNHNRHEVYYGD